jgi:hypothetical protein
MEKKFEITKFEVLETSSEMLKGGFSIVYAGSGSAKLAVDAGSNDKCTTNECTINNCQGGNCVAKCGK